MIETSNLTKIYRVKVPKGEQENPLLSRLRSKKQKPMEITALDHVNLEIRKGEIFGLLGPNGAGKTTLIKLLCTILLPDDGTAQVNGFDIVKHPLQVKKSIGPLFSVGDRGFFWRLDGYKNLEYYASLYEFSGKEMKTRIKNALDTVGLADSAKMTYQRYSTGMKRRLALARALFPDPPILLLDEPLYGLDVFTARTMKKFIKEELSKGQDKTILYTTHNLFEAEEMCDRIGILNRGKILAVGTSDHIKSLVQNLKIVELKVRFSTENQIEDAQKLVGNNPSVIGFSTSKDDQDDCYRMNMKTKTIDAFLEVLDKLSKSGIRIIDLDCTDSTLEDAFVQIINQRGSTE